jgi:hypothetical protein
VPRVELGGGGVEAGGVDPGSVAHGAAFAGIGVFASIDRSVSRGRAGLSGKGGESIMRKLLLAAILATSALLSMAVTTSAGGIPPCC